MRLGLTIAAVLLASGCGALDAADSAETDDFIDMDTPPGDCPAGEVCTSTTNGSGTPVGEPCLNSTMCVDDAFCIAPFEDGMVGEFVCTSACIEAEDEARWCLDSNACCDPNAVCNARGLCIPGAADDTGGSSESGTAGTTGDDTGSTGNTGSTGSTGNTGSSGGTGGSEGSGTDTGTSTGAMGGG